MKQFFKDIMTTKDGQSYDVVRVAIVGVTLFLPWVLIWGIIMATIAYFQEKQFDFNSIMVGVGTFLALFGSFLLTGAGALLTKRSTEPNNDNPSTITTSETKTKTTVMGDANAGPDIK